ncbi:SDR family oxidoreductase [Dyadobacter arcticus]|uniref:NAD(P)-dependent dehydrogenase (Short-subunit alcohol dehydrogenase family) n=1 Tax=Dyadobacter arcticus TaxID=1078754 RepID=A0ABX0USH6_9BACT|nr:SDR family oxidoreductase [Dyadobacter arcticus]NIJ54605.1 NAD(P)-dependent dehydrogenase (short-subunit alcohol dehydrogenase family) [Dyadobacter arcticus]
MSFSFYTYQIVCTSFLGSKYIGFYLCFLVIKKQKNDNEKFEGQNHHYRWWQFGHWVVCCQSAGSITFTGGVSTDRPITGAWVSGLATASAEQLAKVLVMEFPTIRFNAVAPGNTDTPMWDGIMGENKIGILANVAERLPFKKIASADEVASAAVFLMSNASITGEVIHVDGGSRLI